MLIRYKTAATSTAAQIASDLANLCAGADISTLSASCDKVGSGIVANSIAPGWTIVDSAGPTSSVVLSAPDYDGLRTKYAGIGVYSTTNIYLTGYDTYTPGSHSGTGGLIIPSANGQYSGTVIPVTLTAVNTLYLFVTPRYIVIASANQNDILFHAEYTRDIGYLANNPNYPAYCFGDTYCFNTGYDTPPSVSRVKNLSASGDKTSLANSTPQIRLRGNSFDYIAKGNANTPIRDGNDNIYHQFIPINVLQLASTYFTNVGTIRDILLPTCGFGAFGDLATVDGLDYFILTPYISIANSGRLAVPVA